MRMLGQFHSMPELSIANLEGGSVDVRGQSELDICPDTSH